MASTMQGGRGEWQGGRRGQGEGVGKGWKVKREMERGERSRNS